MAVWNITPGCIYNYTCTVSLTCDQYCRVLHSNNSYTSTTTQYKLYTSLVFYVGSDAYRCTCTLPVLFSQVEKYWLPVDVYFVSMFVRLFRFARSVVCLQLACFDILHAACACIVCLLPLLQVAFRIDVSAWTQDAGWESDMDK